VEAAPDFAHQLERHHTQGPQYSSLHLQMPPIKLRRRFADHADIFDVRQDFLTKVI
jgi:hypothetical protein